MNTKTKALVRASMIASVYILLTYVSSMFGLASGVIQVRLSEILCVLAILFPEAIAGLTLGCFISNILTGCVIFDVIFGTLATFIGALLTYTLRKHRFIALFPPVLSNMIIVPIVLKYAYNLNDAWWYMVITVGAGEIISCVILGGIFLKLLSRNSKILK